MKLFRCVFCNGEIEFIGSEHAINRKVKCKRCGFTNGNSSESKNRDPEIIIIKKRN